MLNEKNFAAALNAMNFTRLKGNRYEKFFAENIIMRADLDNKKLSYPAQVKGREHNTKCDAEHKENLVVFECVNRLLDKGYRPEDIWLEKAWTLGHSPKGGRADICVSSNGRTLFIIECKTAGAEFKHERANMLADGGQLFSYWQQEQSCQWLVLYSSDFDDGKLTFKAASVPCGEKFYRGASTVPERFKIWSERYEKNFLDDVIFHDETVAYQIGAKPLRKRDLKIFDDTSLVNTFEEILRHNQVSDKENAFNRLIALFIAKLVDESLTPDSGEVQFQFKGGSDTHEIFQDRLQRLYSDGMKKFMGEDIFYLPEDYPDKVFKNFGDAENHGNQIRDLKENFRKLKFYTNNAFAFVDVNNDKLFYLNAKILKEVVDIFRNYRIIGSTDLQTLGDLFEQLLDKGFKQNEGQFFTPLPITRFIWDSLPLERIISDEPPKIIDYACGAGHFLTEGFQAVNDCYLRQNRTPPVMWERDKLFGVEKDYRLARVSKISLFMHGADEGKIKFGDGLENYPDEKISPATFDILVANPPYSVKGFKLHLKLANEDLKVLDKISVNGSEIETLFAERIGQLVKAQGVAAVILPSSILNNDGKSFIAARESLLTKFFIRAIVELDTKTFGATGTKTAIMFLERFDEPPSFIADFADVADTIIDGKTPARQFSRDIFDAYLRKIDKTADDYRKFIAAANDKTRKVEYEKIFYFGLTYRQTTLIISAPMDNKEQKNFLGYGWSNAKGREGIVHKKRGGMLFDNNNRAANNTLAAVIRAAFDGKQLNLPELEKYYRYVTLSDLLDFDAANFTKKITLGSPDYTPAEYSGKFPLVKLGEVGKIISGNAFPKDYQGFAEGAIPFYKVSSLKFTDTNGYLKDKTNAISEETRQTLKATLIPKNSILFAKIGEAIKLNRRGLNEVPCCIDNNMAAFIAERCEYRYAFYWSQTIDFYGYAKGSAIPAIKKSDLEKIPIPLPPLDMQRQIVAEFNSVDAQIAAQDDTIAKLNADIQAKFSALFEGYSDDKIYSFTTLCKDDTASGVKFQTSEYLKSGEVLIIDQGANEIAGYMNVANNPAPYDDLPCVIFGDHTEIFKLVREKFYLGADGTKIIVPVDRNKLNAMFLFYMLRTEYKPLGGYARHFKNLKSLKLYLPPIELQEKFAAYVTNCEAMKESARRRREELISERAALVTKYFR